MLRWSAERRSPWHSWRHACRCCDNDAEHRREHRRSGEDDLAWYDRRDFWTDVEREKLGRGLDGKSWGGTQILPNLTGNDFVNFQVGDYVAAQGTVDQTGNWSVNATLVRDYTYRQTAADQQKANRTTASQTIKSETPRNYVGIASGIGDGSFTLMVNGEADIVDVNAGAQIVNRNWLGIPLSALSEGDNVRVWGVNSSGTIAVDIVRDVSLPATTTVVAQ